MQNIILISFNFYMFSLNDDPVCWRNYTFSADQSYPFKWGNFDRTWGNFDRPIKVTPSTVKVTLLHNDGLKVQLLVCCKKLIYIRNKFAAFLKYFPSKKSVRECIKNLCFNLCSKMFITIMLNILFLLNIYMLTLYG